MKLDELYDLCRDRPLLTGELHEPNDFYGLATVLKAYCSIPNQYQLKAALEHAPTLGDFVWGPDLNACIPSIFCFSPERFKLIRKKSLKSLFAIGSPIQYAQGILSQAEVRREKARLGNNLLVFPLHSTHHNQVQYDIHKYCKRIRELATNYNSVRICMYWKDVLSGTAEIYQSYGFECTSAGHMFDPDFLPRLRSMIEIADQATGPEGGTSVGYCIALGVPFFLTHTQSSYKANGEIRADSLEAEIALSKIFYDKVEKILPNHPVQSISLIEKQVIEQLWGIPSKRTPEELRQLFEIAEELYREAYMANSFNHNYLFKILADYLKLGELDKAMLALGELEKSDSVAELQIVRANIMLQTGRPAAAKMLAEDFLGKFPNNPAAIKLIDLCQ